MRVDTPFLDTHHYSISISPYISILRRLHMKWIFLYIVWCLVYVYFISYAYFFCFSIYFAFRILLFCYFLVWLNGKRFTLNMSHIQYCYYVQNSTHVAQPNPFPYFSVCLTVSECGFFYFNLISHSFFSYTIYICCHFGVFKCPLLSFRVILFLCFFFLFFTIKFNCVIRVVNINI